ncbi:MAG: succinate dehydrogenase cytochrome b subunit [Ignavibacteriales bacterium]|nr:succinate dehydrogenase cytochrome b subunit [Ignavibacteriales bacterium]
MGWLFRFLSSSIGQKFISGLTGLFLISFLLVHLAGNLQLLNSNVEAAKTSFNAYSHFMSTNPIIRILEIGLVLGFALHIFYGLKLYFANKAARPVAYATRDANANSKWTSRSMFLSGSIILAFLILHLLNFFVKARFGGEEDMYTLVVEAFKLPYYSIFYVIAMILLGLHLNHGFQSAFQTFGLLGKKYASVIKGAGVAVAVIIPLLYAIIPLYFLLGIGGK